MDLSNQIASYQDLVVISSFLQILSAGLSDSLSSIAAFPSDPSPLPSHGHPLVTQTKYIDQPLFSWMNTTWAQLGWIMVCLTNGILNAALFYMVLQLQKFLLQQFPVNQLEIWLNET